MRTGACIEFSMRVLIRNLAWFVCCRDDFKTTPYLSVHIVVEESSAGVVNEFTAEKRKHDYMLARHWTRAPSFQAPTACVAHTVNIE